MFSLVNYLADLNEDPQLVSKSAATIFLYGNLLLHLLITKIQPLLYPNSGLGTIWGPVKSTWQYLCMEEKVKMEFF